MSSSMIMASSMMIGSMCEEDKYAECFENHLRKEEWSNEILIDYCKDRDHKKLLK